MKKIVFIVLLSLVVINLGVIDYFVFFGGNLKNPDSKTTENVVVENKTDESLISKIDGLEKEIIDLKLASKSAVEKTSVVTVQNKKTSHVAYLPISGSLSQIAYDWVSVPGSQFNFNKASYSGLKEIKFESNMKLLNGNGMAFVRLFDTTHGVAVTKSQVQTANQNDTVITSEPINFMDGNNLIEVQIKSLTADSTVFNSGKLVITSEY